MSVLDAWQWFKNGDHPQDGPAEQEGKVVRYYRHPNHSGILPCPHCQELLRHHGWIDSGGEGRIVCPGDWVIIFGKGEVHAIKPELYQILIR